MKKLNKYIVFMFCAVSAGVIAGITTNEYTFLFLPGIWFGISSYSAINASIKTLHITYLFRSIFDGVVGYFVGLCIVYFMLMNLAPTFLSPSSQLTNWYTLPLALIVGNAVGTMISCFPTCYSIKEFDPVKLLFAIPLASTLGALFLWSCFLLSIYTNLRTMESYKITLISIFILLQFPTAIAIAWCQRDVLNKADISS